jgi:hypothetical protein
VDKASDLMVLNCATKHDGNDIVAGSADTRTHEEYTVSLALQRLLGVVTRDVAAEPDGQPILIFHLGCSGPPNQVQYPHKNRKKKRPRSPTGTESKRKCPLEARTSTP